MIAIILSSILFVFALLCTLSSIPKTKKYIHDQNKNENPSKEVENSTDSVSQHDCTKNPIELKSVFATFDKNNDGFITRQELKQSLKNIGISAGDKDIDDMVEKVDSNGDGLIDFDEFCELSDSILGQKEDVDLQEAFDVFDGNKDGLITVEELGLVLSSLGFTEGKKMEDCKEMIRKVDVDGDGMVNLDEFKEMMRGGFGKLVQVA